MKALFSFAVASVVVSLSACGVSEKDMQRYRRMAANPHTKNQLSQECTQGFGGLPQADRENMAVMLDVPPDKLPKILCKRIIDNISNGRLTADDIDQVTRSKITPNLMKILRHG